MWVFILLQITGVRTPESNPEVQLLTSSDIWHGCVTLGLISLLCKNKASDRSSSEACTELKKIMYAKSSAQRIVVNTQQTATNIVRLFKYKGFFF